MITTEAPCCRDCGSIMVKVTTYKDGKEISFRYRCFKCNPPVFCG